MADKSAPKRKRQPRKAEAPALRDPSRQEQERIAEADRRIHSRPPPPLVTAQNKSDGGVSISHSHSDGYGWEKHLRDTFGTVSYDLAGVLLQQVSNVGRSDPRQTATPEQINAALAIVHGMAPKDETEALLAVQMAGTHIVAMTMLLRAHQAGTIDRMREFSNVATKMQRTFTAQIEALAKMRRKGEQTVRVEHVHVYSGGQAVVGQVSTKGGGEGAFHGNEQQSQAPCPAAVAYAPGAEMWSPYPEGHAVPVAGGEGQEAVPDARWREGDRRTNGRG